MKQTWKKIIIGLVLIGIVAAIFVYQFIYNKPHPDYEKADAEYSLAASELFFNCREDGNASVEKYTGKVLEVSGILQNIEVIDTLVVAVFVFDEGMFGSEGVRVTMLPKYHKAIKQHPILQKITLKGFCAGYNDTDVILEKGSIVK
nr:hypothetical protein [Bacteroidota bacterium]